MASPDLVVLPPGESIHPRGLLEALAAIEQSSTNERQGCQIPEGMLTTRQRLEFMEVGMRGAIAAGMVLSLLSPLAVAMLDGHLAVFGRTEPAPFDRALVLLVTGSFSLGYAILMSRAALGWQGPYSRAMVLNLIGGMVLATLVKGGFVAGIYGGLALWLEQRGPLLLGSLAGHHLISHHTATASAKLLPLMATILEKATGMVLLTALVASVMPLVCFLVHWLNLRRVAGYRLEGTNHDI